MNTIKLLWDGLWYGLDGHKTDLLVVLGAVLWLGMVIGWWTMDQVQELFYLLGLLGIATFRDALRK
jgi:hypothetical protein